MTDAPALKLLAHEPDDLAVSVECVDAALADLSEPWPTPRKPAHEG